MGNKVKIIMLITCNYSIKLWKMWSGKTLTTQTEHIEEYLLGRTSHFVANA